MQSPREITIGTKIKNCFFKDAIVNEITYEGKSDVDGADYVGGYATQVGSDLKISFSISSRYNWKTEEGIPVDRAGRIFNDQTIEKVEKN